MSDGVDYCPIARIGLEPAELEEKVPALKFLPSRDDLDELVYTKQVSKNGKTFFLVRHKHQPFSGTDILVARRSFYQRKELLNCLEFLGLDREALTWIKPDINLDESEPPKYDLDHDRLMHEVHEILRNDRRYRQEYDDSEPPF